ncbi:TPA: hypothetical protein DDZ86_01985 [Candidatus Dependentiae bacterium]|nr:MAG: hypothetical protein UW09_C0001G0242 [candidate division TM6 bacterium GW2011_GWF2_43_87]HBL98393.1 hypothetical protein [Candidatus Dependentiae bacterium]
MNIKVFILSVLGLISAMSLSEMRAVTVPVTHVLDEQSLAQLNQILNQNIELLSLLVRRNIRRFAIAATGVVLVYIGLSMVRDQFRVSDSVVYSPNMGSATPVQPGGGSPVVLGTPISSRDRRVIAFGLASVAAGMGLVIGCDRMESLFARSLPLPHLK